MEEAGENEKEDVAVAVVGEKVFEIPAAAARLEIYLEICARSKLKRFETEMKKRFFFRKK